jgi:hypothetical protein
MKSRFRGMLAFVLAALLVSTLSCAHDQQLESITIAPAAATFQAPDQGLNVQLRALGNYIHPPVQKDITNQTTWASNTPDLATVSATGLLSPAGIDACGGALVSATVQTNSSLGGRSSSGALVTGYMTVTVNNVAVVGCPGFTGGTLPVLTVTFAGTGTGTVISSPTGINCTSTCSLAFGTGTSVTLTATPNGTSTFGGWAAGCDSVSSNMCTLTLSNNRTVGVIFN